MIKKIYITIGTFDCFNIMDHHLITQMQKFASGKSREYVLIRSDWQSWLYQKQFPSQNIQFRCDNVLLFTKFTVMPVNNIENEREFFRRFIKVIKQTLNDPEIIYVSFNSERDFPVRQLCREKKIPVRFINYGTKK